MPCERWPMTSAERAQVEVEMFAEAEARAYTVWKTESEAAERAEIRAKAARRIWDAAKAGLDMAKVACARTTGEPGWTGRDTNDA